MEIKFYTLLYIDLNEKRQLRGKNLSGENRLKIFLKNAALLDKSLAEFGNLPHLTILTNNPNLLRELSDSIGYCAYNIQQIDFTLPVPQGIRFYSAHFKIDAFKWLGEQPGAQYSILVDNDVLLLNPLPAELHNIAEQTVPMVYKLPGYNIDLIMADSRKIIPQLPPVTWCGGEFVAGTNSFWGKLYNECLRISKPYFDSLDRNLFHVGDEMITSIAVSMLESEGLRTLDAGALNIITRYWGASDPRPFKSIKSALVHLPADKVWLCNIKLDCKFTPPHSNCCIIGIYGYSNPCAA